MATINGSVSDNSDAYSFYITWSESKASDYITTNKTTVTATAYIKCTDHYAWASGLSQKLVIDGTEFTDSISVDLSEGVTVKLISGSKTITHSTDGSKSIKISADCDLPDGSGYGPVWGSASATVSLTTIPRYATSVQSLSSKTETSITMKWSSDNTIDYIWYSTDNGSTWSDSINVTDGKSGTYTISKLSKDNETKLSPYTTYKIKTRVRRKDSKLTTDSSATSVTTYQYPYCTSSPNFTIGNSVTISLYNPLKRSVTITMVGADGSTKTTGSYTGTSVSGFYNSDWQEFWYASIPKATSGKYKVIVTYGSVEKTRNNGNTYSVHSANCAPTFSNCEYVDVGSVSTIDEAYNSNKLTGDTQTLINGFNSLQVIISTANKAISDEVYGTTMSKYRLVCGNQSVEASYSDSADVTLTLNHVTNMTFVVYAIDSRGISTSVTKSATTWKDYSAIAIKSASVERTDGVGTETILTFEGTIWDDTFGAQANEIVTCQYKYKKTNESTYSDPIDITPTIAENSFSFNSTIKGNLDAEGFSVSNSFNIQIIVTDKIKIATYNVLLGVGTPAMAIHPNGVAFGGPYDENIGGVIQAEGTRVALNTKIITTADTDLNDYTTEGRYYFSTSYTPTNIPAGSNGILEVFTGTNFIKQIWFRHGTINSNDFQAFVRTYTISGWSNWRRLKTVEEDYYQSGDTETIARQIVGGYVTSSTKSIRCSIMMPKKMDNVTPTITGGTISARASTGGYLLSAVNVVDYVTSLGNGSNVLVIYFNSDTAYNTTNNTPVSMDFSDLVISFK